MTNGCIAKVIKAHPEANAVDLVYVDSGAAVPLVQVSGHIDRSDIPEPTPPADPAFPLRKTGKRDVYAAVGFFGGMPLVLGFLKPQVHPNLFKGRPNFRVDDHPSDVYSTLDDAGNFTMAWPNGTSLVVGEDPTPEDLSGKDFDAQRAAPERNTGRSLHVRLVIKSGGDQTALIHITPDGDATIELAGDLALTVHGNLTAQVDGTAALTIDGAATASAASWSITGPATFEDNVTVNADLHATGTITGDADVIAGTISGKHHSHTDPQGGSVGAPT